MRLLFGILGVGLVACGTDVDDSTAPPPPQPRATWYHDAGPIISEHCMSCHQDGGIAPFSLTTIDDARDNAQMMMEAIGSDVMPPWGANEESDCTPRFGWKDDPRLSEQEKTTLQWWVDDGLAAGAMTDVPVPATPGLTGVTQTLAPTQSFTAAGTRDQFICTVLDPGVPSTSFAWLNGLQVRPGNPLVVHHAVIGEVFPTGASADAIASQTVGVPWDCSQEQMPADLIVNIWTPGNQPMETPSELAVPVLGGAKFVMQIHYHPAGTIAEPDTTSLDLRASQTWPSKMYFVGAFGNASAAPELLPDPDDRTSTPEFRIPADIADHQEHMTFPVDLGTLTNVQFYSVNPHMHLIGTHINSTIVRPAARGADPQTECLANGTWNFDWQRTYQYDVPIAQLPTVQTGDVIDVNCHWNNTLANPFEQRALADAGLGAPVDVTLGEGQSTDEMCLEIFGISTDAPAEPAVAQALRVDQMPSQLMATMSRLNVQ